MLERLIIDKVSDSTDIALYCYKIKGTTLCVFACKSFVVTGSGGQERCKLVAFVVSDRTRLVLECCQHARSVSPMVTSSLADGIAGLSKWGLRIIQLGGARF